MVFRYVISLPKCEYERRNVSKLSSVNSANHHSTISRRKMCSFDYIPRTACNVHMFAPVKESNLFCRIKIGKIVKLLTECSLLRRIISFVRRLNKDEPFWLCLSHHHNKDTRHKRRTRKNVKNHAISLKQRGISQLFPGIYSVFSHHKSAYGCHVIVVERRKICGSTHPVSRNVASSNTFQSYRIASQTTRHTPTHPHQTGNCVLKISLNIDFIDVAGSNLFVMSFKTFESRSRLTMYPF